MTRLRNNMHIVLYALLAAFLALIVFEWGMNFSGFSGGGALAGKVNGKPIEYRQYEQVYDGLVDNFRRQSPQAELTDGIERALREKAWEMVVDQVILEEQFDKYAISVADGEIIAAVESDNPPMVIFQNFFDPETGAIDRDKLDQARMDPENSEVWIRIEEIIRRELMVRKLQRVLLSMVKVSDREVEELLEREFAAYSATFLPVPFSAVGADSLFSVTEKEIDAWYRENREDFRQDPVRSLEYVLFSAIPTDRDSMAVKAELEGLAAEFAGTADDSAFVSLQSDRADTFNRRYSRADFSPDAGDALFGNSGLKPGLITGPVADDGFYRLVKVHAVSEGEPVARASHILIPFQEGSPADKRKANELVAKIMREIRSGTSFAALAGKYSKDPGSAARGGDLGWFGRNAMVPEFDDAVFNTAVGALTGPVETEFGLHLVKVTGRDNRLLSCSEIVREIRPSSATIENARRKAAEFQMEAEEKGFDEASVSFGMEARQTGIFSARSEVPGVGFNNVLTRFAFSSSEGDVSDVVNMENGFLVARVDEKNDSGYRELDGVLQDSIRAVLLTKKKGEALDRKLDALLAENNGDLGTIASALGGIRVVSFDAVRYRDMDIPGYGRDVRLMEALTGMKPGDVSRPVPVENGRAVVVLRDKSYPGSPDLDEARDRIRPVLENAKKERFIQDYFQAERNSANIEDLRTF
ncbi:peptidylprolyl isomerase [Prosthecochloris sp. GSB1]|uniref:peptidylprolyl isomerase n=1 Tax=Prosthecochloris sp. GSB1 TaxID=281093 RepID=UPI002150295C|nr:peptidyl-prolyl cis-trans isomerase [Prosthecochloris sp. GSB1]